MTEFAGNYEGPLYSPHPDLVERADMWHPDPEQDRKLGGPGPNARAREDRADAAKPKKDYSKTTKPGESYMDFHKRTQKAKAKYSPELQKRIDAAKAKKKEGIVGKIKRKLGLKDEFITYSQFMQLAEGNPTTRMLQKSKTKVTGHISADRGSDEKTNREGRKKLEKDLKKHGIGHKKGVGEYKYSSGEGTGREVSYQTSKPDNMSKRRFGKVMRRLGRKHGQESVITKDKDKPAKLHTTEKGSKEKSMTLGKSKAGKHPQGYGETSGTKVRSGKLPKKTNKPAYHYGESASWTKKSGQNSEGGLNEKGRKSYERENPGSDLKAPSKKVGNPRRASFCARMKGMKDKLTSKKTASDPDSRINKSLRAWNC